MISAIFAHGGGIDEIAMFFGFPTVVGVGVWLLTRQKPDDDASETSAEPSAADVDS